MKLQSVIATVLFVSATSVSAEQPYGPYNQQFTMNQQYGSTNWYSSPLGMGVAQAGVALIGGLVNVMSRPDPSQYVQQQQQPVYVNGNGNQSPYGQRCQMQQVYDQSGNPRTVNVCQ